MCIHTLHTVYRHINTRVHLPWGWALEKILSYHGHVELSIADDGIVFWSDTGWGHRIELRFAGIGLRYFNSIAIEWAYDGGCLVKFLSFVHVSRNWTNTNTSVA